MAGWNGFWGGLSRGSRIGLALGAATIVTAVAALGWSMLRTPYGVLFSELSERDMATMSAELERQKVPYRLSGDGRAMLVPQEMVHKVRLKLMGAPMPLHGAVGFELFNTSDFAMTEFAQKVNYQRALQGELTRTILSLQEVESARVHLALPEQGMFRKATVKAKASVTLRMRAGRQLAPEQVTGIQRLVAASVNDIAAEDVAVLDEHGVVLSRSQATEQALAGTGELDLKQGAEAYLSRKAMAVVDRMFGPGEALVSVDAVFDADQVRVTTEEIVPARAGTEDGPPTGVVVRERVSSREGGSGTERAGSANSTTQETEYQAGKRVHQVVTPAGQLKRLQVAVVLRRPLDEAQIDKVRELVSTAVGLNPQRGDRIAVHSMPGLAAQPSPTVAPVDAAAPEPAAAEVAPTAGPAIEWPTLTPVQAVGLGAVSLLVLGALTAGLRRRRALPPVPDSLNIDQRQQALAQVEAWLADSLQPVPAAGGGR